MAAVTELRRVLDGGEPPPGLAEADLLELHRRMVLLRTYDERSVVFHRQGRIGTYAIFWNHEAIQAGATFALEDRDWIFPSYRESAIGLVRGMPVETILQWWRGHPSGWWSGSVGRFPQARTWHSPARSFCRKCSHRRHPPRGWQREGSRNFS